MKEQDSEVVYYRVTNHPINIYILLTMHEGRTGRTSGRSFDNTDRAKLVQRAVAEINQSYCSTAGPTFSYYYMAVCHKDWELLNSRIWLGEIDFDRGLDFPI